MINNEQRTLVLDIGMQPIGVISWQKAFCLWVTQKVEIVENYADQWVHSAKNAYLIPAVVRLCKSISKKSKKIKFSRLNIFNRDKSKCQYCAKDVSYAEFTLDHVLPRGQGGTTKWENVVVACVHCNQKKANRTPEQSGMDLRSIPVRPSNLHQGFSWMTDCPPQWKDYCYWNVELENVNT